MLFVMAILCFIRAFSPSSPPLIKKKNKKD